MTYAVFSTILQLDYFPKILTLYLKFCYFLMQFLGNWYILEYEYAEETRLNQVDCLGFKFTVDDIPLSLDMSVMTANFTFRFPPKSGFSYHVPTYAFFSDDTQAKWTTTFKNGTYFLTNQNPSFHFFTKGQLKCVMPAHGY